MVVNDNQGLLVTIDGGGTAQTHGGTRTQVTRVGHNVETCNLSLQSLVDRLEGKTFHIVHTEFLSHTSILTLRNLKACGGCILLSLYHHLLHSLDVVRKNNLEHVLTTYLLGEGLVAHEGDNQSVVGILDIHGKVTIHIRHSLADNTIVLVPLHNVGTHDDINLIRYGTGDTPLLCTCGQSHYGYHPKQYKLDKFIHSDSVLLDSTVSL